ncbi:MAG: hypothetical protein ACFFDR_02240, partial [Candidatus Thorarchaeota archaeon]
MSDDEFGDTQKIDLFDIGSLFRTSATLTFVIQIIAVIVMFGSLAGFYIGDIFPGLPEDIQVLLFLIACALAVMVFLAALSVFLRFSRRIGNAVIGPGIEQVRLDSPKVKLVVYAYGILVFLMGIIGVYIWIIVNNRFLVPWVLANGGSILLTLFSYALGAFFIALLIQVIIATVGRSSTKIIIEVLDAD